MARRGQQRRGKSAGELEAGRSERTAPTRATWRADGAGKKRREEEEEEVDGEENDMWVPQEGPNSVKNSHLNPYLYPCNQTKNLI